jgi:hypothetical protein
MELLPVIERIVQTMQVVGFALFAVFISWAAFLFMTSGGDPQAISKSRAAAFNSCVGLAILFLAPIIGTMVRRVAGG